MSAKLASDLSTLELLDADTRLRLRLSCLAHFASSEEGDFDIQDELTIHEHTWRKTWTFRAQTIPLIFELASDATVNIFDDEECQTLLLERLQDWQVSMSSSCYSTDLILVELQIWKELNLSISSIETTAASSTDCQRLTIMLNTTPKEPGRDRRLLHKLNHGVPLEDVKPPFGVVQLQCEAVQVCLNILCPPTTAGCQIAPTLPESRRHEMLSRCRSVASPSEDISSSQYLEPAYPTPPSSQESTALLITPTQDHQLRDTEAAVKCIATPCDQQHFARLLMSAVEAAFLGGPSNNTTKVKVTSSDGFRSLTSIAPELWSPRLHDEVSKRTTFLPTISRALSNVAQLSKSNADIKGIICELSRVKPADTAMPSEASPAAVQNALSLRLWHHAREILDKSDTPLQFRKRARQLVREGGGDKKTYRIADLDALDDEALSVVSDEGSESGDDSHLDHLDDLEDNEHHILDLLSDDEGSDCWDCASASSCDSFGLDVDDRKSACDEDSDLDRKYQEDGSVAPSKTEDRPLGWLASHVSEEEFVGDAFSEGLVLMREGQAESHDLNGECLDEEGACGRITGYGDASDEMLDLG